MAEGGGATTAPPPLVDSNNITNGTNVTISFEETMVAYASLYGMAVFCIVLGAVRSVGFVYEHIKEQKLIESSITTKEAKKFPFTASAVLFGLYVFFRFSDILKMVTAQFPWVSKFTGLDANGTSINNITLLVNETVNGTAASVSRLSMALGMVPRPSKENLMFLLLLMLCWEGSVALGHLLKPFFTRLLQLLPIDDMKEPKANLPYEMKLTRAKTGERSVELDYLIDWKFDTHDLVSVAVCSLVGLSHILKKHWISNDLIGMAFSIYGIEALHLASFKGGALLLAGLFVYDVFWVFATDVMTTVATGVNAPILLQFPQDLFQLGWEAKKFAMLGLGDIVIPGIFVALLRRFDCRVLERGQKKTKMAQKPRFYFQATMGAYAVGLVTTIAVMHFFKAAQPALLYLVPLCLGVPLVLSLIRGEFDELFNYTEEHLVKKDEPAEEKEKKTN